MSDLFLWWLLVSGAGAATFCLLFSSCRGLPDRGYALSKPLGLLLPAFSLWLLGTIHAVQNTVPFIAGLFVVLVLFGVRSGLRQREALLRFLRSDWDILLFSEAFFLAAFALAAWLRSYVPEITGTEKPFEFAVLNAVLRADYFPPEDPWYAGAGLSYYYLGYLVLNIPSKLAGTPPEVVFNLGLALIGALTTVSMFGLGYNLVASLAGHSRAWARARLAGLLFGLLAVALLLVLSNLEGVLEFLAARGVNAAFLYQWFDIVGLEGPKPSPMWYPTEYWWWWRATRLSSTWNVMEFPFFSFLLGDLHPHVLALPFTITALNFTWNLVHRESALSGGYWLERPWLLLLAGILFGGLGMLNTWDAPTYLAVLAVAVVLHNRTKAEAWTRQVFFDTALFVLPVGLLVVFLYWPFYRSLTPAVQGIAPTLVLERPDFDRYAVVSPFPQLFLFWGPFFWLTGAYLLLRLRHARPFFAASDLSVAALVPGLLVGLWLVAAVDRLGIAGLGQELVLRGSNLLSMGLIVFLLLLAGLALLGELRRGPVIDGKERRFELVTMALALYLLLGTELFFVVDLFPSRLNTVFKLYFAAWLLLSISSTVALADLLLSVRRPRPSAVGLLVWSGSTIAILSLGLVFPVMALFARTNAFTGARTLDGLAYLHQSAPYEYEAIQWLREHGGKRRVIVEAAGGSFTSFGRVSSATGYPTLLGWTGHQLLQRGASDLVTRRMEEVREIYAAGNVARSEELLRQHGVTFIYVGRLEREEYHLQDLSKFDQIAKLVYHNPEVSIYRFSPTPQPATEAR